MNLFSRPVVEAAATIAISPQIGGQTGEADIDSKGKSKILLLVLASTTREIEAMIRLMSRAELLKTAWQS